MVSVELTRYEIAGIVGVLYLVQDRVPQSKFLEEMLERFTRAYNESPLDGSTPGE